MDSYSLDYIDDLYVQYIRDPASVSPGWRKYFEEFSLVSNATLGSDAASSGGAQVALADEEPGNHARSIRDEALWLAQMQDRVDNLVREYRVRGHLMAKLDPLKIARMGTPELDPESYGLNEADLQTTRAS